MKEGPPIDTGTYKSHLDQNGELISHVQPANEGWSGYSETVIESSDGNRVIYAPNDGTGRFFVVRKDKDNTRLY